MNVRTSRRSIVFDRPFSLTGADGQLPAGTYVVETDEAQIEDVSFLVYRRVAARMTLTQDPMRPGVVETVELDSADIEMISAQSRDTPP